jgi:HD-GYP domain-containing protein (c-di-GMP phosphodiesterase class II)
VISNESVDQYLPIAVETLSGDQDADFDLFFHAQRGKPLLFRSRSVPLVDADLQRLFDSGVKTLLIGYSDRSAYEEHLHAQVDSGGQQSLSGKYALLTGSARSVFESALRGDSLAGMVGAAEQFGSQLADMFDEGQPILREMFDLMLHDYSTFTHSANVATYCVSIAQSWGNSARADLAQIAAGSLLHDIGKRGIPRRVLNAPRKLTAIEREAIQRHPQIGFEELSTDPALSWGQLMIVYQHHERIDGGGYPVGIVDDEIHPWAKICAVADVFDALTSNRPYHAAISAAQACDFLERRVETSFDPEIVRCLTTMMLPA